jgi:hypothetical protein
LGIGNSFKLRQELSSVFMYSMIDACGGPFAFYGQYYITSLSPLGFVKNGKNYNYYDDKKLAEVLTPYIEKNIETQIEFGADRSVVYCLGQGKNFLFLESLNKRHGWWERVVPLPHPRWIMQYKRKRVDEYVELYKETLLGKKD